MRRAWVAAVGAACSLTAPRAALAQTTATLDVGVSTVRYDGFLPSGAAAIAPALRWERPGGWLAAQGTYLQFESGNVSVQGTVTGSLFTTPARRWQGQILATVGGSSYAEFASFGQTIGEARLHRVGEQGGFWLGGTAGRATFGAGARAVTGLAVAGWTQQAGLQLFASATRALVGDTAYSDLEVAVRRREGSVMLEGYAGARIWSRGGGRGVYGEGSATFTLASRLALVLSGGRYPTDPIRGSISGRYAGVAIRVHSAPPRRSPPAAFLWHASPAGGGGSDGTTAGARLELLPQSDGSIELVVHAPGATVVEIAGDFTDWQPVTLERGPDDRWATIARIPSGLHRLGVRIDGGAWRAPVGARREVDDFDGEVGIVVVPS